MAGELRRTEEDLRWGWNPELTLAGDRGREGGEVVVVGFSGGVRREGGGEVEIGGRAREAEIKGEGVFVVVGGAGGRLIGGFQRESVDEREGLRRREWRRRGWERDEGEGIGREEVGVIRVCHGKGFKGFKGFPFLFFCLFSVQCNIFIRTTGER